MTCHDKSHEKWHNKLGSPAFSQKLGSRGAPEGSEVPDKTERMARIRDDVDVKKNLSLWGWHPYLSAPPLDLGMP